MEEPATLRPRQVALAYGAAAGLGLIITALALVAFRSASSELASAIAEETRTVMLVERLRAASERIGRTGRALAATASDEVGLDLREARTEFRSLLRQLSVRSFRDPLLLSRVHRDQARYIDALEQLLAAVHARNSPPALLVEALQDRRDALNSSLERLRDAAVQELRRGDHKAYAPVARTFHLLVVAAIIAFAAIAALGIVLARASARLTARRLALVQLNEQLRAANEDLEAFSGRVAHDLRNLLTPLSLSLSSLVQKADDPDAVRRGVERSMRVSGRAESLVKELLDFARAGHVRTAVDPASVSEVVSEVRAQLEGLRATADATIAVEVEELRVACTPAMLHVVLSNLVGNALKFLIGETGPRCVDVRAHRQGSMVVIEVADTGPGIPLESQPLVFRPFFRSPEARQPGTGLGLATVKRIVEAHAGELQLQSSPQGSRFTVRLPAAGYAESSTEPRPHGFVPSGVAKGLT